MKSSKDETSMYRKKHTVNYLNSDGLDESLESPRIDKVTPEENTNIEIL